MLVPFHPLQSAVGTHSKFPSVYFYPDVHTAGYHLREVCGDPPIHTQLQEPTESLSSGNGENHSTVSLEVLQ